LLTTFYIQYACFIILSTQPKWTNDKISDLLDYLTEHKSEMTDVGNFKAATFNGAATAVKSGLWNAK
jgi:hypothetical protein